MVESRLAIPSGHADLLIGFIKITLTVSPYSISQILPSHSIVLSVYAGSSTRRMTNARNLCL